jgi:uncharacterized membrane protein YeiH
MSWLLILDFIGITAFAATGAMVAGKHNMDLFGALTLAFVTGIGGGTLRDLLLDTNVFWLTQPHAPWACLAGFLIVYLGHRFYGQAPKATINSLDAVGLAVFSVLGAAKAIDLGHAPVIAVLMGFLTGCGGGMLRDVLANDIPLVLSPKKLYATPSLIGATLFVVLQPWSAPLAIGVGFAATLGIRMASIFLNWRLPVFPSVSK